MNKSKTEGQKPKVLVTGGAGFIGSNLVDRLVGEGFSVAVVDDLTNGRREYLNPKARFHRLSVTNPELDAVFAKEKPQAVFHLAAHIDVRVSLRDPIHDADVNIRGSLRVLQACLKHGVKKLVFSSSGGAIYHDARTIPTPETAPPTPLTPYGVAKLAFELYLYAAWRQFGLPYVALRYSNVYGPRQDQKGEGGVIGVFCKALSEGRRPSIFGGGRQTRDFLYVDDAVEANLKALRSKAVAAVHVSTGKETSVNRVASLIGREFGWKKGFGTGPAPKGDVPRSALDPRLAAKLLGWKPKVGIEEGIRRTAAWFKASR